MNATEEQKIRQLFENYLRMYSSRDDQLTTYFSADFSGFTGGGDSLVKDREEWVAITRQDFAQIKEPIHIELKDLGIQSLSETVAVATSTFVIHLPIKDHVLSRKTARLVLIFRNELAGWKISHSSISIPFGLVREGEVYPLEELVDRNQFLEELIAERTTQLSEANDHLLQANLELARGIAQRKEAQAEQARLARSIEQVGESVIITDPDGSIVYVNPAFEKITGFTQAEAIGRNPRILKSDRHPAAFFQEMWGALLDGETWSGNLINKRKDGSLSNTVSTISPIKDQDGRVINFVAVSRDVTSEVLLRNQLNLSQKIEAVGRLAGGIAHDFNNLLMVIQTYAEMLQDGLPIHDSLRLNTEQILKAAERGASLTGQMLAFSRQQIISPVALDLNAVIGEATNMLKRVIGEDIEFQVAMEDSLWATAADPDQIFQVLMNLCVNSRDAMPHGGTLTIKTRNEAVKEGGIRERPYVLPGEYVMLSVADTGLGMSQETQENIFEPFFTTKEVGKGTGLGLAMVYGTVKQSGGYLWVDSEIGQGTCFTIFLPRVKPIAKPTIPIRREAPPRGTETLLVVEDEEFLRKGISDFLRGLGYKCLAASSGQKALIAASQHEHIDLLLTDVVMPKMSGRELSQTLGALRPDLKVIHMSGYTDDEVLRSGIHESRAAFLQKPFTLATLARKVRDILDGTETVR
jgi:PAS domain S-box-containing protein